MRKKIKLTQGKYAIVDEDDFKTLSLFKWCAVKRGNKLFYAQRRGGGGIIYMHREILKPILGMEVDHIDRNGLNNSRANLRICTHAENQRNQSKPKNNKSGVKGVFWDKERKKWCVQIRANGFTKHIGRFDKKEDAIIKRKEAEIKYYSL